MKNLNSKLIVLLAAVAMLGVGCAKESQFESDSSVDTANGFYTFPPTAPPGSGEGSAGDSWNYGNTVTFSPVSFAEMTSYVALHPLNAPTNIRLNVNLVNDGSGRYYGHLKIAYRDNNQEFSSYMDARNQRNQKFDYMKDNNVHEAEYNRWFTINGKSVFTGFFSDAYGGIVLVIEGSENQGDGQGGGLLKGSIWYRNFAQTSAPQSPYRRCWFVYDGPYNCRSSAVINKNSLTIDGYRKLGTFTGLSKTKAFNSAN